MNYKLLGRSGLRVSEICLGTMTFGTEWGYGADKDESRTIFNTYTDAGGNFYDTANRYTEGTSETFLGEFIRERGNRIESVVATKYSLVTKFNRINDGGNHRKNLVQSVEGSLSRLKTDYIDVLYLHAWDFTTPEEEVLRGLDDLVRSGKIIYIAISDTPAWLVSRMNTIAELRGWSSFIGLQVEYSLITRDAERDLLPMADHMGIGVTAWAPLAGGALSGKYLGDNSDPKRLKEGSKRLNEKSTAIAQTVVRIASENNCSASQVALRWMMQKHAHVFPVVGARNAKHIADNLGVVNCSLSEAQMKELDNVSAIDIGFPHDFLQSDGVKQVLFGGLQNKVVF